MTSHLKSRLLDTIRCLYDDVIPVMLRLKSLSPFELLVSTIISQNTNWKNVEKAIANMRSKGLLSIDGILKADVSEIEGALRVAGLYRVKARRIKEIAEKLRGWGMNLDEVLAMRFEDARSKLMELPAVGYKTADVVLAFKANAPVIPIDTHIERIVKRLGLVEERVGYEDMRAALESFVPPNERALFHLALIKFGREVCKARRPNCHKCPLSDVCRSSNNQNLVALTYS
ncbi:MAG: endonuclease III [Candidatus Nezhaarchaeota archaeon]|nr:endonuclease III [Candidatus Nezhaarchaeota archaeon]